jgi:nucleotidyltransferase/DNA polymerase involved in DNA repair
MVPTGSTAITIPPGRLRDLDVEELKQVGSDSESKTEHAELGALSMRAKIIANRHPADAEIQTVANQIAETVSTRAQRLHGGVPEQTLPQSETATQAPKQAAPSVSLKGPAELPKGESTLVPGIELTPAAIDRVARMLARYVGPISGVLAKRAAQRADSLRALYLLLAEHVESKADRDRFLRDGGFSS